MKIASQYWLRVKLRVKVHHFEEWNVGIKAAPLFGFLAGHKCPTNVLRIRQYSYLNSLVFSRGAHVRQRIVNPQSTQLAA